MDILELSPRCLVSTVPFGGKGLSLAIGNFDGIHLGHRRLFRLLVEESQRLALMPCALTFNPHPKAYFSGVNLPHLADTDLTKELLAELGISQLLIQPFTAEFAAMRPEQFIIDYLIGMLGVKLVCVGENFRFGANRAGDYSDLIRLSQSLGIQACSVPCETLMEERVSSSRIRDLIESGDMHSASTLLGRSYSLSGSVEPGRKLGRTIDIPTLNIAPGSQCLPKTGVYCGLVDTGEHAKVGQQLLPAVINIGYAPTVSDAANAKKIEVHIIDSKREYGVGVNPKIAPLTPQTRDLLDRGAVSKIRVFLHSRLRDERKFSGVDQLREQIFSDIFQASNILSDVKR